MKHTPGPWEYSRHYFKEAQGSIFMPNAGERKACTMELTGACSMSQQQLDANAKFIIRACNLLMRKEGRKNG